MQNGTVKFFNQSKGFGFIAPEDGSKDVFVHISTLRDNGISEISEGDKVDFDTTPGKKGPKVDRIYLTD